jgi:ATP-dependent DNA helicase RecQ
LRRIDPDTRLGDIAVLARSHTTLQPLRALCEVEAIRYILPPHQGTSEALPLMQSREGRRLIDSLRAYRRGLLPLMVLARWLKRRCSIEPTNPFWSDLHSAVEELRGSSPATRFAPAEVIDWFYEFATDARRDGNPDSLRLLTAHGAKGLEFRHVIVMDCGDWKWGGEDERRLLYVAMTRAKESLTLFKPEDGRTPFLSDLSGLDGVRSLLPENRPQVRSDLHRAFINLGPGEVDLGFAGRAEASAPIHSRIASIGVGTKIHIEGRAILTSEGQTIGRIASKVTTPAGRTLHGVVTGIMVRTRAYTAPEYLAATRVERWEVVLAELVDTMPTGRGGPIGPSPKRLSRTG